MVNKLGKKSKLEPKLSSAMPNNLQISLKCVVQSTKMIRRDWIFLIKRLKENQIRH
jgi:hypothetical protein